MIDNGIIEEATEAYEKGLDAGYAVGQLLRIIKCQKAELEMTRKYIHDNGLEWDLLSYSKRNGG